MRMLKSKKGFTLIELLIVITIIGILAVAFLPTLLGAPAKGRDTQRIADLQKIQKVMVAGDLENTPYPPAADNGAITDTTFADYLTDLGGTVPTDPEPTTPYEYFKYTNGNYNFALIAYPEIDENNNANCNTVKVADAGGLGDPGAAGAVPCYAILVK